MTLQAISRRMPGLPKLFEALSHYSRADWFADLQAGITVGLVSLPLAMAFGIASGVTPQAGIYTAIVGGLIVSVLGGSRLQIAGPTGAFTVIVASILAKHGMSALLTVTMLAGVFLVILGATRLGAAVKFIPRPVVIGFTNGIAVLIASTQIKDLLGLSLNNVPVEFIARIEALTANISSVSPLAIAVAAVSLALILTIPRFIPRLPGTIAALMAGTLVVYLFQLPVETIGSRFGGIPAGWPPLAIPPIQPEMILVLLPSAMTVAVLAAVESLLSAVVADSMSGDQHDSNTELIAQGVANIAVPLVGGIPVTGAIARTATNYRSGAHTPVAGIIHSITLLFIVLAASSLAKHIPLATLAAVLLVVAYNMGEWREIPSILRLELADKSVWLITFLLTVVADLTVAVEIGLVLAALLYVQRVSQTTTVSTVTDDYIAGGRPHVLQDKALPPYVTMLRILGPFLFGATEQLASETADLGKLQPIVILRLRNMTAIDATGLHAIENFAERLRKSGRSLILCGALPQPSKLLHQAGFRAHLGEENICPHVQAALKRAAQIYQGFAGVGEETALNLKQGPW